MIDPCPIRFRNDGWFRADDAARIARGIVPIWSEPEELVGVEPAKPGDIWRVRWYKEGGGEGPIAGYSICCPRCLQVHSWTGALNCPKVPGTTWCAHNGTGSCWNWSGSAEEGTLTATPSLHCLLDKGGCGWHGFLTGGVMKHC